MPSLPACLLALPCLVSYCVGAHTHVYIVGVSKYQSLVVGECA